MSKSYLLHMTDEEHAQLKRRADASGMSIKDFLLNRSIGSTPRQVSAANYSALEDRVTNLTNAVQFMADGALAQAKTLLSGKE